MRHINKWLVHFIFSFQSCNVKFEYDVSNIGIERIHRSILASLAASFKNASYFANICACACVGSKESSDASPAHDTTSYTCKQTN